MRFATSYVYSDLETIFHLIHRADHIPSKGLKTLFSPKKYADYIPYRSVTPTSKKKMSWVWH